MSPIQMFDERKFIKVEKDWFLRFIFIFWVLLFIAGAGFFIYQKFFKKKEAFSPLQSLGQIELIPRINLEFDKVSFKDDWMEHVFHESSKYALEAGEDGKLMLHASSQGTSSVIFKPISISLTDRPFLMWDWKATQFPSGKQNKKFLAKEDNDFVGRVYVIYGGKPPFDADIVQYVWDDHFPEGISGDSPFSTKILVVQSGKTEGWASEKRDLLMDYHQLFGRFPKGNRINVVAIGLMTDSDNTNTNSEIFFRHFEIKSPKDMTGIARPNFEPSGPVNPVTQIYDVVRGGTENGMKLGFGLFENVKNHIENAKKGFEHQLKKSL